MTFTQWVADQRRQRLYEESLAKESGATLSGSGAASGAALGAGLGLALAPFTFGASAVAALPGIAAATTIGPAAAAAIGAGVGGAAGALAGPKRMKPGKGPYAQPGNIAEDNARIWKGITDTATTIAAGFKKAKTSKAKDKANADWLEWLAKQDLTPEGQFAASEAFVQQIPESDRQDVAGFIGSQMEAGGFQMPAGLDPSLRAMSPGFKIPKALEDESLRGLANVGPLDVVPRAPAPPAPAGGVRGGPLARPSVAPGLPTIPGVTPGIPPAQRRGLQQAAQQPQGRRQPRPKPQRELTPEAKAAIKRLNYGVKSISERNIFPEQKSAAIAKATKLRQGIVDNPDSYREVPTIQSLIARGQIQIDPGNGYSGGLVLSIDPDGKGYSIRETAPDPSLIRTSDDHGVGDRWIEDGAVMTLTSKGERKVLITAEDRIAGRGGLTEDEYVRLWEAARKRLMSDTGKASAAQIEAEVEADLQARKAAYRRHLGLGGNGTQRQTTPPPTGKPQPQSAAMFLAEYGRTKETLTPEQMEAVKAKAEMFYRGLLEQYKRIPPTDAVKAQIVELSKIMAK
jgi:hypothetical protein